MTNNAGIARVCGMLRDHGQAQKYYHDMEGYNGRLDAMQAEFLRVKLGHVNEWNAKRRGHAKRYAELFAEANDAVIVPYDAPYSRSVYHLYVIRTHDRDDAEKPSGCRWYWNWNSLSCSASPAKGLSAIEDSPRAAYPVTERVAVRDPVVTYVSQPLA